LDDKRLRAYLLGQLPEIEAEQLETRALDDEEFYLTLKSVEDDLFDDFARNSLRGEDHQAFLAKYGANHEKLVFARALAAKSNGSASNVIKFPVRRLPYQLAAAAVLVLAVGTFVVQQRSVPNPASRPTGAPPVIPTEVTPPEVTATANLVLGSSRAAGEATVIAIPPDATRVQLRVKLNPADRFEEYALEARSSRNNIVWGDAALKGVVDNGDLIVAAFVPAKTLAPGTYELAVRGIHTTAKPEELGFITFEIRLAP
jgi:hypothetical protein